LWGLFSYRLFAKNFFSVQGFLVVSFFFFWQLPAFQDYDCPGYWHSDSFGWIQLRLTPVQAIKRCRKIMCNRYINNKLLFTRKYAWIFVHGCYLSRKIVSFDISKHIFAPNGGLLCLLSFIYFLQHAQFWKLGNITQVFPSYSWGIFSHVTYLNKFIMHWRKYLMD